MKLSPDAVNTIFHAALFTPDEAPSGEPPTDALFVDGLVNKYAFHPERIAKAKPEIDALLSELPDNFGRSKGGGWTFLNACEDRHGSLWTGYHREMERLICLGIAVGSASWLMKDMADILPGGVPYFEVHPAVSSHHCNATGE